MSVQKYPCADCHHCIPIGDSEGLCDYKFSIKKKFIVNLFEVYPYCPKPTPEERRAKETS